MLTCQHCGYEWLPRTATPKACPQCKTRHWNPEASPLELAERAKSQGGRSAVTSAVKHGLLPRPATIPCVDCGKPAQEYHHHLGYAPEHWLNVVAVCRTCHRNREDRRYDPSDRSMTTMSTSNRAGRTT